MQFAFYRSFWETIQKIKNKDSRLAVFEAICSYSLDGIVPELTGEADLAFTSFKRTLDLARMRAEKGRKGGKSSIASNNGVSNGTSIASTNESSNGNDNGNENGNGNGGGASGAPALDAVVSFFKQTKLNGDPEVFYQYYQARGWVNIKDWQAAAIAWSLREKQNGNDEGATLGGTRYPAGVTPQTVSGTGKFKLI